MLPCVEVIHPRRVTDAKADPLLSRLRRRQDPWTSGRSGANAELAHGAQTLSAQLLRRVR